MELHTLTWEPDILKNLKWNGRKVSGILVLFEFEMRFSSDNGCINISMRQGQQPRHEKQICMQPFSQIFITSSSYFAEVQANTINIQLVPQRVDTIN